MFESNNKIFLIFVVKELHTSLPDDNSGLAPPDPISNSEVKRTNANGSAGSPCVRVGNRQAFILEPTLCGLFFV